MPSSLDIPAFRDARSSHPWLIRALNGVGRLAPKGAALEAEAVWDEARKAPGLAHLAPTAEAAAALEVLLESLAASVELTLVGRFSAKDDTIRLARTHLRVHQALAAKPELAGVSLPPPVFVIGWPRTGTTFLHQLLSADPESRTIPYWESFDPVPPAPGEPDRRIERLDKMLGQLRRIAPRYDAIHPMTAESAEECVALFMNDFRTLQFDFQYRVPDYARWLLAEDARTAYADYRRQLQLIHHHRATGRRQVLKDPTHLVHFETIVELFPEAKFVLTHRDPAEAISSICSLTAYTRALFTDDVDSHAIGREVMSGYWPEALDRSRKVRESLAPGRVIDIRHADLRGDPLATAASIYEELELLEENEGGMGVATAIHRHLSEREQEKTGKHAHSLEGFGLTRDEVRERFADYCAEVDV